MSAIWDEAAALIGIALRKQNPIAEIARSHKSTLLFHLCRTHPSTLGLFPVSFSKLEILESQRCYLSSSETTADQKREQSTIASAAESLSVFRAQQLLA